MSRAYVTRAHEPAARLEAAYLLDQSHAFGERGPRTFLARKRLAAALDLGFTPRQSDLRWLRAAIRQAKGETT